MTNLITLRKSTFDWAYSIARFALNDLNDVRAYIDDVPAPLDAQTIHDEVIYSVSRDFGFKRIWRLLTTDQQITLVAAVSWALNDRQYCDPCYSAKVDRHMRAHDPMPGSDAWYDVILRPAHAA